VWKLGEVSEPTILKVAILQLFERCVAEEGEDAILLLPKQTAATRAILQASFIKRLLAGDVDLKSATCNDVSSAQADLRHLTLLQLLCIRMGAIDFQTSSGSHSAHSSFLESADALICERLARRGMAHGGVPLFGERRKAEVMRAVGFRMLRVLGVKKWFEGAVPLPFWWAVELDGEAWEGYPGALFRTDTLAVYLLREGERDNCGCVGGGKLVGVPTNRSTAPPECRSLRWEVLGLDPRYDDILAALGASREGSKAGLMKELTAAVEARRAAMGALAPEPRRAEDGASSARSMSARSTPQSTGRVLNAVQGFEAKTPPQSFREIAGPSDPIWTKKGWKWHKMRRDGRALESEEPQWGGSQASTTGDSARSVLLWGAQWPFDELPELDEAPGANDDGRGACCGNSSCASLKSERLTTMLNLIVCGPRR